MNFLSETHGLQIKFDNIELPPWFDFLRRHNMMFTSKKQWLVIAALAIVNVASCTSNDSEDDESMEVEEPIDAAPESAEEAQSPEPTDAASAVPGSDPAALPEAKPSDSVSTAPSTSSPDVAPVAATAKASSSERVMYVKYDGVAIREKPDSRSKRLGKLNRGDHRLVTIEGDWARTSDGKYIAMKSLSEKGVGAKRKGAQWSGGGSGAVESAPSAAPAPSTEQAEPPKKLPKRTKSAKKKAEESPAASTAAPAEAAGDQSPKAAE